MRFTTVPTAMRLSRFSPRNVLRAFTLVEIMIVVVIIGLLAAMALPMFQRVRNRSLASRMANDIRQCEAAFQRYALENGGWPPPNAPGQVPAGMENYIPAVYTQATVVGGNFSWSGPNARLYISNTPTSAVTVMQMVDALLDDGDLSTGTLISNSNGYTWQLY